MKEIRTLFDKYYYMTIFIIARNYITRRYQGSYLGAVWTMLVPISQIAIYSFIMPKIMRFPSEDYVPFLISSLLIWFFLSNVIPASAISLESNAQTITRCLVSKTIFPLAELMQQLYTSSVSITIGYIFSCVAFGIFNIKVLLLPLYMGLVLMALAPALIAISFIAVYIKDFKELLTIVMNFAFWATPVVYPIEMFPEDKRFLFFFNPFYIMMKPISGLLYKGEIPSDMDMLRLFILIVISITVSYSIYRKLRKNFIFYL
jgi:lipopolysaccharide transport system permease protein